MGQLSFFDADKRLAALSAKGDPLEAIARLVPWESFRDDIEAAVLTPEAERKSMAGRKPIDAIVLFRMLILQSLYNLSDEQVEYQVRDRLSFTRFLTFGITEHEHLSRETVRRRLADNDLKPWRKDMWCIPQVDGEYVARMEDVLDLYAEAPDPTRPVVCFDESPTQLIGEVRKPIRARSGQIERYDSEYKRNGTANLFIVLDVNRPWRKVKVTDSRTAIDFAICMRELADVDFPAANRIRVVLDNLSIHSPGALYQAFPACEARRLLRRLEFHYVPKHASWLNMVEIEIGVLRGQCLNRRIATKEQLVAEIAAWQRQRNASGACIKWMFTTEKARAKNGPRLPQTVRARPKNHNHCAAVLVSRFRSSQH